MEPAKKRQRLDEKSKKVGMLYGLNIFLLQAGIGKARCELFKKQVTTNGGLVNASLQTDTTYVIVDEKMDIERLCRILKLGCPNDLGEAKVVKSLWLSSCLKEKSLLPIDNFELVVEKRDNVTKPNDVTHPNTSSIPTLPSSDRPCPKADDAQTSAESAKAPAVLPNDVDHYGADNIDAHAVPGKADASSSSTISKSPKVGVIFHPFTKKAKVSEDGVEDVDSDYAPSGDDDDNVSDEDAAGPSATSAPAAHFKRPLPKGNWVCAQASSVVKENFNKHITDKLEELARTYENTNDKWRALGYQKAIGALKRYHKEITTFEEAKALRGVGNRLAEKIWEIVESGELRKLTELSSSEEIQAINLFTNVWGAGAATARAWVTQGYRTLDDLRTKANLTRNQRIGLTHYDDILDRMPRAEATEIEAVVKVAASKIDPDLIAMACGSYRRGKATCGDVDILITHPDGRSHRGVFHKLLASLRDTGFITDDLVTQEDNGNQKKYLGVCRLPGENRKHRRLDIIVVPHDEFACALMYFTGSAHLNRSMRNLAGKMGMSLNEHGLFTGVIRKGAEKLNKGTPLPCPTEQSVFEHLGLTYRAPEERDH